MQDDLELGRALGLTFCFGGWSLGALAAGLAVAEKPLRPL